MEGNHSETILPQCRNDGNAWSWHECWWNGESRPAQV